MSGGAGHHARKGLQVLLLHTSQKASRRYACCAGWANTFSSAPSALPGISGVSLAAAAAAAGPAAATGPAAQNERPDFLVTEAAACHPSPELDQPHESVWGAHSCHCMCQCCRILSCFAPPIKLNLKKGRNFYEELDWTHTGDLVCYDLEVIICRRNQMVVC